MKKDFRQKTPGQDGGYLMWRVTLLWQRKIRAILEPCGLTQVQFAILASILWLEEEAGKLSQQQIADFVGIEKMMTSEVLRTLEKKKLVKRVDDQTDGRRSVILLTPAGRRRTLDAFTRVDREDRKFFGSLKRDEASFVNNLLQLIGKNGTALD